MTRQLEVYSQDSGEYEKGRYWKICDHVVKTSGLGSWGTGSAFGIHTSGTGGGRAEFVVLCLHYFFIHVHFARGMWRGEGVPAALYSRWRRFWYAYKRDGRVSGRGFIFVCA